MNKTLLTVLVLALLAVLPAAAQDDAANQTIAEIVGAAAAMEESAEFTVLLAALEVAEPEILEALSDESWGITVFAPTDAAFEALLASMEMSAEDLLADTDLLTATLWYHMVVGKYTAADLANVPDSFIGTYWDNAPIGLAVVDENVMLNGGANVIEADIPASNGFVHVINAVLLPPEDSMMMGDMGMMDDDMSEDMDSMDGDMMEGDMSEGMADDMDSMDGDMMEGDMSEGMADMTTIIDLLAADPNYSTYVTAATAIGLNEELDREIPYTIFAPTNDAFDALLSEQGITIDDLIVNEEVLRSILLYHCLGGMVDATTLTGVLGEASSVEWATQLPGETFEVMVDGEAVMVDAATVIQADMVAANGVVHGVDTVILP